jgi:N6-L-threonylcarbamoyladenine synthase
VGVNHLEGHINSVFLEPDPPPFPFVTLLASGGHTSLYYVTGHLEVERMGQTRDDAAGEAYDKVAKMLGLGYPGGKIIDQLAAEGDPDRIKFPRTYLDKQGFDFSFSGIKTAVNRYVQQQGNDFRNQLADIAAGFQTSVVEVLAYKVINAAGEKECNHIALVGGVAANSGLRQKVSREAGQKGIQVHIPSIHLCGDNAAMIAAAGYHHLKAGHRSHPEADVFSRSK